jgi:DNA polymerase III alpha subunit
MKINHIKKIRKQATVTVYGSLEKISKKISRKGEIFYILAFSNRSGRVNVGLLSPMHDKDVYSLFNTLVSRVRLKVSPYKYYSKNVSSLRYDKRTKNRSANLKIMESSF